MQHDKEWQKPGRILVDMPTKYRRQDDRMAEAADRKQLGDALHNRKENCLEKSHVGPRCSN